MNAGQPSTSLWDRPFVTLFLVTGAVAIFVVFLDVLRLAVYFGLGRLRQIQALSVIWGDLAEPYIDLLEYFPVIVNVPFDLRSVGGFLRFLSLAMVTGVAVTWALACLLLPLVALGRWAFPCRGNRPVSCRFWQKGYPLAVAVGAYFPEAIGAARRVASTGVAKAVLALVYAGILWWLMIRVLRQPSQVARFLRVVTRGGAMTFLITAALSAGLTFVGSPQDRLIRPPAAPESPNILLVSIDSLRNDHLHCYGYPRQTSPTIDRLAAQGALFTMAVAPTSWTLPSHLTMLTSLPPLRHGVVNDGLRLDEDALTLAEVLWRGGYSTAGFVSGPYLDASYGFSQGFDTYDDYSVAKPSDRLSHRGVTSPKLVDVVTKWLVRWSSEGKKRPFFLFVHMWDVHYDYTPPPPYDTVFDPEYNGGVTGENVETDPRIRKDMEPRDLEHLIALYDGEIRYTDEYLSRILDLLISLKVLDDTIVVLTSDHGEEFFEHGHKTHRKALYDESILVPLIIRFPPRVSAGVVVPQQVRLMDIPPTILSLAGINRSAGFGIAEEAATYAERDLSPLMTHDRSKSLASLPAFLDLHPGGKGGVYAIRTDRYKLLQLSPGGFYQLFDLIADPGEHTNLLEDESDKLKELSLKLAIWKEHWRTRTHMSQRIRLTRDQEEKLRSLGYIK